MKQLLYKPKSLKVRQVVECMGYVELSEHDSTDGWFGLCPNGTSNLTISLSDQDQICYHNNKGKLLLYSSCTSPVALKRTKSLKFINIQFKPFGMYCIKGIPMHELQNTSMTLDMFISSSWVEELLDRLYTAPNLLARFVEVEKFLFNIINPDLWDERMPHAVALIKKLDTTNIDELSSAVCLSSRRFRELFSTHTGFSPGFYKKTVRFNKASVLMANHSGLSLTEIALANYYYDQSHFIKDFKFFAGITPSQYLKQTAKTSDFYNFDLLDLNTFASTT
ncbi:MAG: AraC family transcriptional regulator [Cyclobacteriaceae bacterium]